MRAARASAVAASIGVQGQGGGTSNNGWGLAPGLSIPLFDRNQDGVARANARVAAARARFREQRVRAENDVVVALTELEDARESWTRMRIEALPVRTEATRRVALAHAAGDLSGVDEVDARLSLARTELAAIDSEAALLMAWVRFESVVGGAGQGPVVDASTPLRGGQL